MSKVKVALFGLLFGFVGVLVGLGVYTAYRDYADFRAMRLWVAQMQQLQADAAKQQQRPAQAQPQAPAEAPK